MTGKNKAKKTAEMIIDKYALPIPFRIEDLVIDLGLSLVLCSPEKIIKVALAQGDDIEQSNLATAEVLGYYGREERKIYINNMQSINRLRFTIAHEIGHHSMHEKNGFRKMFVTTDLFSKNTKESEANYFAGYLLIPDKEIERKLPLTEIILNGQDIIDEFSTLFAVSSDAMRIRLKTFKEENPILWDKYCLNDKLF